MDRSILIRQHIPGFIDGLDSETIGIKQWGDLDRVSWIQRFKYNPDHKFDSFVLDKYGDQYILMALYDNGDYWLVVGYASELIPEAKMWERENDG